MGDGMGSGATGRSMGMRGVRGSRWRSWASCGWGRGKKEISIKVGRLDRHDIEKKFNLKMDTGCLVTCNEIFMGAEGHAPITSGRIGIAS